jgi:hypothetical protein
LCGQFGAPLEDVGPQNFASPAMVFQIGVEPNRIDILMGIEGVEFSAAWDRRVTSTYGGTPICVISREDLIANKKTLGRPKDLEDLEALGAD